MDWHKVHSALLAGLVGAGIGWGANALTLSGRVAALEDSNRTIILRLDTVLTKLKGAS